MKPLPNLQRRPAKKTTSGQKWHPFRTGRRRAEYSEALGRCQLTEIRTNRGVPTARKAWLAAASCVLFTLASPSDAAADNRLWLQADVANLNTAGEGGVWGPGLQVGGHLGLTDFWALFVDLGSSYHFGDVETDLPDDLVTQLGFGVRYNLDVFTYVPYAGLGITGYIDTPLVDDGPAATNLGAKFIIGVDWRFDRHWSLGFKAELHALATDLGRYPIYSTVGLNVAWHFRL